MGLGETGEAIIYTLISWPAPPLTSCLYLSSTFWIQTNKPLSQALLDTP